MTTENKTQSRNLILVVIAVALVGILGFLVYEQQNKETVIDINIGGKQFTAEIER